MSGTNTAQHSQDDNRCVLSTPALLAVGNLRQKGFGEGGHRSEERCACVFHTATDHCHTASSSFACRPREFRHDTGSGFHQLKPPVPRQNQGESGRRGCLSTWVGESLSNLVVSPRAEHILKHLG